LNVVSGCACDKCFALRGEDKRKEGLQVLAAKRHASLAIACYNNVVNEARERRDAADEEGHDGTPVGCEFRRVAVNAMEVVHVGYGHVTTSDDVVAAAQRRTD
jgi:hypothetical protein